MHKGLLAAFCFLSCLHYSGRLMKQLTILGSTGSIGCSTLDVVRHNPDSFSITALVAGKNVDRMVEQCLEFSLVTR
jgi:1-deoxy-D-xylulose-5-phosphate reductoisomerase